jgi:hypothetical protein
MSQIALTNPVVGASVSDFTNPTYTLSEDVYPGGNNGLQFAVTALGGTQADVLTHSIARPFTLTVSRPKNLVSLGVPGPDGFYNRVGMNVFKVTVRKGVDVTTSVAGNRPSRQWLVLISRFQPEQLLLTYRTSRL